MSMKGWMSRGEKVVAWVIVAMCVVGCALGGVLIAEGDEQAFVGAVIVGVNSWNIGRMLAMLVEDWRG
jgi:hypothetical protein